MTKRQPGSKTIWPDIWLVSDARGDAMLERVLAQLPRGSGLIFRHYHLAPDGRRARFDALARIARRRGHVVALAGTARQARCWGADIAYGPPHMLSRGPALPRLVTAHSLRQIGQARRARSGMIVLSPVFATRSHPGARPLGALRFRLLAAHADCPVIALGGMNAANSRRIGCPPWAAIDGLCDRATRRNP